ncbi:unnamed protein product [Arctia plantaginis]|uniref:Uncharacterized protein n=1 Tax=Arctia plantaginis TaxID=874455 RepID=A0A8S1ACF8_ARCPL|nr:unnamed protein product [Arctia plantaginis]CAB3247325.1 unnamed protein product [Arctia plantaginis]
MRNDFNLFKIGEKLLKDHALGANIRKVSKKFSPSGVDDHKDLSAKYEQTVRRQTWDYVDMVRNKLRRNNDDYIQRNHMEHSLFI